MVSMHLLLQSAAIVILVELILFILKKARKRIARDESPVQFATKTLPPLSSFEYDVFLSFRGEDTRKGFTDHLYFALEQNGIRVFRDNEGIQKGDRIGENLLQAIHGSAIAIPIFSRTYAESSWCLSELAEIIECGRLILPIFYDVDPSDVRHPERAFKEAFRKHGRQFDENTVKKWRDAMTEAAGAAGYDLQSIGDGYESRLIQIVVERVRKEIKDWIPRKLPTEQNISPTAKRYCTSIIDHLKDPNVQKIGVWGMGGVGKTCVVLNVYNMLQEERDRQFDHIMFVSVPYKDSMKYLRNEIAKHLLIRNILDEKNELNAASLLNRRLDSKKYLLILDDLWGSVDLKELGVPEPTQENGCKIIVTTRIRSVCDSMSIEKVVKVMPLPPDEALEMFKERVGNRPEDTEGLVRKISDHCDGLPLAIVVVAESLKNQSEKLLWIDACENLRNSRPINQRMKEQVFDRLKLSYDRLETGALRDSFLSCAFYIDKFKDISTGHLVEYFAAEGLTNIIENIQLGVPIGDGFILLYKLKDVCLLEEIDRNPFSACIDRVTLKLILYMNSGKFISENLSDVEDAPSKEEWESAERISLRATHISRLSRSPNCPQLNSLMFGSSYYLEHIPDEFFAQMGGLRVLDLSFTNVRFLPSSISKLVNLRYLSLKACRSLETIDTAVHLKSLVFFNLTASAIEKLPKEISGMKNLRVFRLDGTVHLKEIESGAISALSSLETLDMEASAYAWRLEGTSTEVCLQELGCLSRLEDLKLKVASQKDFEYIKEEAKQKWSNFYTLKCYIQENSKIMEFDRITKIWTSKTVEDPAQEYIVKENYMKQTLSRSSQRRL